jgi:hypothetical protein
MLKINNAICHGSSDLQNVYRTVIAIEQDVAILPRDSCEGNG